MPSMAITGRREMHTQVVPAMFLDMNDDAFAKMVAEEVKNRISAVHKKELMRPENWGRWQEALIILSENLEEQVEDIRNDADTDERRYTSLGKTGGRLARESKHYYEAKIKRIERFKFHVDKRLDEVSMMIETGTVVTSDGWEKVDFYRKAIIEHRSLMRKYDLEDTSIDRALWATLDDKWTFDDINSNNI
jgi:hypothetical protein